MHYYNAHEIKEICSTKDCPRHANHIMCTRFASFIELLILTSKVMMTNWLLLYQIPSTIISIVVLGGAT